MAKKATAKQLAARKKFTAMVKAKAAKKGSKTATAKKQAKMPMTNKSMTKKAVSGKNGKMPMVNGKPAWLAKKTKKRK